MAYHSPVTLRRALDILEPGDATVIAGGTDFFPGLAGGRAPDRLLDVTGIPELRNISRTAEGWRIGGAVTWTEILEHSFPPAFDGLKAAAREVGSVQIQNAGTVAGNICNASPAADGVPPLMALEAIVETASTAGGSRMVRLEEFISGVRRVNLEPGEIVVAVHVPEPRPRSCGAFVKLGSRKYLVISITMVAALVCLDAEGAVADARIAVGACSPVARRLPELERAAVGRNLAALNSAGWIRPVMLKPLAPLDDIRGSADYRMQASIEICRRALVRAAGSGEHRNG